MILGTCLLILGLCIADEIKNMDWITNWPQAFAVVGVAICCATVAIIFIWRGFS